MKNLNIDKKNYIQQNFGNLITAFTYNSAKDEYFNSGLANTEEELYHPMDLTIYTEDFQFCYDRWKEYYESMFYEFIEPNKLIIYNSGIDPYVPNNEYVLVCWPESQIFMEEEWFQEEAILEAEGKFGSSAYLIPKNRLK